MDHLVKLIEQYERENPGQRAIRATGLTTHEIELRFALWLANQIENLASRPTCGKEQRLFLDEVEKYGHFIKRNQSIGFAPNDDYDIDKVINGE